MKKLALITLVFSIGLTFQMCKKGDDALFLLPPGQESSSGNSNPAGVPTGDLAAVPAGDVQGDGTVQEITGDSATPPTVGDSSGSGSTGDTSGDSSGSGSTGDTSGGDNSGSGSTGDTSGDSSGSGSTGDTSGDSSGSGTVGDTSGGDSSGSGSTGDTSGSDNSGSGSTGDSKSKDGKSKDSKSKDSKSKDGKSKDNKSSDDKGKTNLVRLGKDICSAEGKWFKDASAAFTYEAGKPAGFCFKDVASGKYEVRVMARHWVKHGEKGDLPKGFKEYKVMVAADGVASEMNIAASATGQEKGTTVLDITGGNTSVLVAWMNGKKDVNFAVHQVKLQRVGDSERSALAAYLSAFSGKNYLLMLIILAVAVVGIVGVNRLKKAQAGS